MLTSHAILDVGYKAWKSCNRSYAMW